MEVSAKNPRGRPLVPQASPPHAPGETPSGTRPAVAGSAAPAALHRSCRQPSTQIKSRHRDVGVGLQTRRLLSQPLHARRREPVVAAQTAVDDLLTVNLDQPIPA